MNAASQIQTVRKVHHDLAAVLAAAETNLILVREATGIDKNALELQRLTVEKLRRFIADLGSVISSKDITQEEQ